MSHGKLTVQVAKSLLIEFAPQRFITLHDHRPDSPDKLGKIRSWFGSDFAAETILADLDIAVVSQDDNKIYALIEIEETHATPKVILGDILATLLGDGIAFQSKHYLKVGPWTTFILMVYDHNELELKKIKFLAAQTNGIKEKLTTPNASIRQIIVDTYKDGTLLESILTQHVCDAISAAYTECNATSA